MPTNTRRVLAALAMSASALFTTAPATADAPLEDETGWSCVDDGNRVCGPENDEGKPAGCYDTAGVLVAAWPCEAVER